MQIGRPQMKICTICKTNSRIQNSSRCRECNSAYNQKSYRSGGFVFKNSKRRQDFINAIKDLPCQDCERKFPPECMDFDHRDPELRSFSVKLTAVGFSEEKMRKLMLEVSKCDLVCANCHRIRTKNGVRSGLIKCGSRSNGKTSAFQAVNVGSIPTCRSRGT